MTPLEHLRATQHNDQQKPSDAAWDAYMTGLDYQTARLDLAPLTATEARMLGRSTTT